MSAFAFSDAERFLRRLLGGGSESGAVLVTTFVRGSLAGGGRFLGLEAAGALAGTGKASGEVDMRQILTL